MKTVEQQQDFILLDLVKRAQAIRQKRSLTNQSQIISHKYYSSMLFSNTVNKFKNQYKNIIKKRKPSNSSTKRALPITSALSINKISSASLVIQGEDLVMTNDLKETESEFNNTLQSPKTIKTHYQRNKKGKIIKGSLSYQDFPILNYPRCKTHNSIEQKKYRTYMNNEQFMPLGKSDKRQTKQHQFQFPINLNKTKRTKTNKTIVFKPQNKNTNNFSFLQQYWKKKKLPNKKAKRTQIFLPMQSIIADQTIINRHSKIILCPDTPNSVEYLTPWM